SSDLVKGAVVSCEVEQLRFWVRGENGSYKKYNEDVQEKQLVNKTTYPGEEGFGVEPEAHHGVLTQLGDGQPVTRRVATVTPPTYSAYYRQLADALAGKGEVPVTPES